MGSRVEPSSPQQGTLIYVGTSTAEPERKFVRTKETGMDATRYGELSFWHESMPAAIEPRPALASDLDVAIVGAGYTGLWMAYYLKRLEPERRLVSRGAHGDRSALLRLRQLGKPATAIASQGIEWAPRPSPRLSSDHHPKTPDYAPRIEALEDQVVALSARQGAADGGTERQLRRHYGTMRPLPQRLEEWRGRA